MINSDNSFKQLPGTDITSSSKKIKRILGIDPGLANTGFGVIDYSCGKYRMVSYGCITTKSTQSHSERLLVIYNRIQAVIDEFRPNEASMEALFFVKNVSSGISVAEAKGVVTLCLAQNVIPLCEYKPNQIKQAVTGSATAATTAINIGKFKDLPATR